MRPALCPRRSGRAVRGRALDARGRQMRTVPVSAMTGLPGEVRGGVFPLVGGSLPSVHCRAATPGPVLVLILIQRLEQLLLARLQQL